MSLFFLNVTPVKSPYLLHRRTDPVFFFGCCTPSHPPTFNLDTQTITCSSSSSSSQRRNRRMEAGPAATMVQMMARDRVIDFGKHRGRMLGSLPSGYLRWMSENLRAREMEEWSKLADEVLQDPVYRDRLEWEFAEAVLKGNSTSNLVSRRRSAVSELVEISERFGWDNEDKLGWSRIDLQLLGTSMGGRIPRRISSSSEVVGDGYCNSMRSESSSKVVVSNSELGEKMMRRRRREIRREIKERSRRGKRSSSCHMNHGDQLLKPEVEVNNKLHTNTTTTGEYDASATDKLESWSIFPGRQELLRRGIPPIRC